MINPESSIDFIMKEPEVSIDDDKVIHNKNSRKNTIKLTRSQYEETSMVWKLSRFLRKEEFNNIDFQYISSSTQLSNGLSYEPVLSLLNSKTVFENYLPKENDFLSIRMEYKHPEINKKSRPYIGNYISFIYSHEWVVNKGFDHIDREYETLYEGEVKIS
ncbi:hypothetical protein EG347_10200 [Chryseobacterium sp. G0186]|uniref:hypothetical protein n=1 Tax=Chryseobacterium sp. G0186 TaxID=2487064 RepID=UPI000F4E1779|nr:hypothetical protein [Chryseobacterium sp. G0186]AZA77863.1 hypothetical protein EG347_10200 [Chryseobacterium sp. G0186]